MSDNRLTDIQKRAQQATPGPWGTYGIEATTMWESVPGQCIGSPANTEFIARVSGYALPLHANVEFIMHAREDIPWLLTRIAELEALVPTIIEQCVEIVFAIGYAFAASEDTGIEEKAGTRVTEAIAAAIRKYRDAQPAALRGEEITDAEEEIGTATEIIGD